MSILYFIISFISSVIGAISGIGGGIIIKPVLDASTSLGVSAISYLSGCTILAMSAVSLLRSRKTSVVLDFKCSAVLSFGGIIGGVAGKYIFDLIKDALGKDAILGIIQSGILLSMTAGVLIYILNKDKLKTKYMHGLTARLVIGISLGAVSAFLGIGGGPMNIAILYYFFSMDAKTSALNSLFIIFFSQLASLATVLVQQKVPQVDPIILLLMIVGGISGALLGSKISHHISVRNVEKFFCALMVVVMLINIYNIVKFALLI
ncbi:MAG: sulfite exporter TauE/SafE family protein [Saccharofermentanales bacterium]